MIRLSRLTDYAIVILSELARGNGDEGGPQSAAGLSVGTGIPEPTVAKVLKILARDGLLHSTRGVNGGYQLGRAPDQLSLAEIVGAMNGPVALTACVEEADPSDPCCIGESCRLKGRWEPVNRAVAAAFENVTLADMMAPAEGCPAVACGGGGCS